MCACRLREAVQEKTRRVEDEEGKKRELLQVGDARDAAARAS